MERVDARRTRVWLGSVVVNGVRVSAKIGDTGRNVILVAPFPGTSQTRVIAAHALSVVTEWVEIAGWVCDRVLADYASTAEIDAAAAQLLADAARHLAAAAEYAAL